MAQTLSVAPEAQDLKMATRELLSARTTPELVIGLVGPVASGVTTTGQILSRILRDEYDYAVHYYTASAYIKSSAHLVGADIPEHASFEDRVERSQEAGNKLRDQLGNGYLAAKCIEAINRQRTEVGMEKRADQDGPDQPKAQRVVHIIDSIKNPAEVEQLLQVYGRMFWLFAIFAPESVRKSRLIQKGCKKEELDRIIARDQNEEEEYGQKVRDTIEKADFFVRNDRENDIGLTDTLSRDLEILFHATIHTPTEGECAMYEAQAAAANSACMSRQVGAAIYSKKSELISVGWNDVPKPGGGLYGASDGDADHRCFKWGGKICHNDANKSRIRDELYSEINAEISQKWKSLVKELTDKIRGKESSDKAFWQSVIVDLTSLENKGVFDRQALQRASKRSGIDALIEFSRAVHAEMHAIISAARGGRSDLDDATLYCTTFPCHSCARHIVASGIKRVVYIEPYPKSKAHELHSDGICLDEGQTNEVGKVLFIQYEGVAPKNVLSLFKSGTRRKDKASGIFVQAEKKKLRPLFTPAMDGFTANELLVVRELAKKEKKAKDAKAA